MEFFSVLEPRVYDNIVVVPRIVTLNNSKNISSSLSRNSQSPLHIPEECAIVVF